MNCADAAAALTAAFRRIDRQRMADMPLRNPRLTVAASAFQPWRAAPADAPAPLAVGVLLTPWTINLVLLAADPTALRLGADQRRRWRFACGDYEMMGGEEPECGCFQFCPLVSPPLQFADQAAALAMAQTALQMLLQPQAQAQDGREAARQLGASALKAPLNRRAFLRSLGGVR